MKRFDRGDPLLPDAIEAIDTGNTTALQQLLEKSGELATKRLETPDAEDYFKNPYLLWFTAYNPIRQRNPPINIVEVAKVIIGALGKADHSNYQSIIDYTLELVSTGTATRECGVQIPLMELLVSKGAKVKGGVLGAISQYNFEAAEFLIKQGAGYNLPAAVGLNRTDDINRLVRTATAAELHVALVVASFFGKVDIISLLIAAGAGVNDSGSKEDYGGFHAHASALHQAVSAGSLESVKILVKAGADLDATDKIYNSTPLDWARHKQMEENEGTKDYKEIVNYLAGLERK